MNKQVIGHNSPGDPRRPTVPGVPKSISDGGGPSDGQRVGLLLVGVERDGPPATSSPLPCRSPPRRASSSPGLGQDRGNCSGVPRGSPGICPGLCWKLALRKSPRARHMVPLCENKNDKCRHSVLLLRMNICKYGGPGPAGNKTPKPARKHPADP